MLNYRMASPSLLARVWNRCWNIDFTKRLSRGSLKLWRCVAFITNMLLGEKQMAIQ
jgi:hypothetical protein